MSEEKVLSFILSLCISGVISLLMIFVATIAYGFFKALGTIALIPIVMFAVITYLVYKIIDRNH